MNKNTLKEKLEQGQIIFDYINNHLVLAWNELTLLNQAIDQNKKVLNLTLHHIASLTLPAAAEVVRGEKSQRNRIIFAFPNIVENYVFFDEGFIDWIAGFAGGSGVVYIMSPSLDRGYAKELVDVLEQKGLPYRFFNFMITALDAEDSDPFDFLRKNIFNAAETVYTAIVSGFDQNKAAFYIAHSTLVGQNYNFKAYPIEPSSEVETTRIPTMLSAMVGDEKLKKRVYVPNEVVATHNAAVYAIACRWRDFLLENKKNKTLKQIIEWQNTLDQQVVENKRLMMRYRGAITDEDIQELAVLNAEGGN